MGCQQSADFEQLVPSIVRCVSWSEYAALRPLIKEGQLCCLLETPGIPNSTFNRPFGMVKEDVALSKAALRIAMRQAQIKEHSDRSVKLESGWMCLKYVECICGVHT